MKGLRPFVHGIKAFVFEHPAIFTHNKKFDMTDFDVYANYRCFVVNFNRSIKQ